VYVRGELVVLVYRDVLTHVLTQQQPTSSPANVTNVTPLHGNTGTLPPSIEATMVLLVGGGRLVVEETPIEVACLTHLAERRRWWNRWRWWGWWKV